MSPLLLFREDKPRDETTLQYILRRCGEFWSHPFGEYSVNNFILCLLDGAPHLKTYKHLGTCKTLSHFLYCSILIEERLAFNRNTKLCLNCFGCIHNTVNCRCMWLCKFCGGSHCTSFCPTFVPLFTPVAHHPRQLFRRRSPPPSEDTPTLRAAPPLTPASTRPSSTATNLPRL